MIDLETNPLYYAAIGGIILGIATSIHYVLKGNVTGISGIIYDVVSFNMSQFPDKIIIVGGIIMAAGIFFDIFGYQTYNKYTPFGPKEQISAHTSFLGFALAGLLVGFGTKLGNGCTSGHGLCGMARLSIRSFVAVGTFLSSAIGIATLKFYVTLGPFSQGLSPNIEYNHLASANICIALGIVFFILGFALKKYYNSSTEPNTVILRDNAISLVVGFIFGLGLLVSGMTRRINILQFLWMCKIWNPSLLFVLGCGVAVNLVVFNYMIRVKKSPIYGQKLFNPNNKLIDWKLIFGAFCFGLGWGIGGLCPGPALALLPVFQVQIHIIWFVCLVIGMLIANKLAQITQKPPQEPVKQKIQVTNQVVQPIDKTLISTAKKNSISLQNSIDQSSAIVIRPKPQRQGKSTNPTPQPHPHEHCASQPDQYHIHQESYHKKKQDENNDYPKSNKSIIGDNMGSTQAINIKQPTNLLQINSVMNIDEDLKVMKL